MAEFDFDEIHEHIEESCIQFMNMFDGVRGCTLCYKQLPFESQYASHTNGTQHCSNTNKMYEKLINQYLSPGIVLLKDCIFCSLCSENLGNRFDGRFRCHILDYYHVKKVNNERKALQEYEFDDYYNLFDVEDYSDIFVEGVSRALIRVTADGELHCEFCDRYLPGYSQFRGHVQGSTHIDSVVDQLKKLADKAGISLGIVIDEDGDFVCKLCGILFTSVDNVYSHLDNSKYNGHDREVQEQIDDGLYDSSNDDDN